MGSSPHLHVVEGQSAVPGSAVLHPVAGRPHWRVLHLSLELSTLHVICHSGVTVMMMVTFMMVMMSM